MCKLQLKFLFVTGLTLLCFFNLYSQKYSSGEFEFKIKKSKIKGISNEVEIFDLFPSNKIAFKNDSFAIVTSAHGASSRVVYNTFNKLFYVFNEGNRFTTISEFFLNDFLFDTPGFPDSLIRTLTPKTVYVDNIKSLQYKITDPSGGKITFAVTTQLDLNPVLFKSNNSILDTSVITTFAMDVPEFDVEMGIDNFSNKIKDLSIFSLDTLDQKFYSLPKIGENGIVLGNSKNHELIRNMIHNGLTNEEEFAVVFENKIDVDEYYLILNTSLVEDQSGINDRETVIKLIYKWYESELISKKVLDTLSNYINKYNIEETYSLDPLAELLLIKNQLSDSLVRKTIIDNLLASGFPVSKEIGGKFIKAHIDLSELIVSLDNIYLFDFEAKAININKTGEFLNVIFNKFIPEIKSLPTFKLGIKDAEHINFNLDKTTCVLDKFDLSYVYNPANDEIFPDSIITDDKFYNQLFKIAARYAQDQNIDLSLRLNNIYRQIGKEDNYYESEVFKYPQLKLFKHKYFVAKNHFNTEIPCSFPMNNTDYICQLSLRILGY